jgi:hypothetical protein
MMKWKRFRRSQSLPNPGYVQELDWMDWLSNRKRTSVTIATVMAKI